MNELPGLSGRLSDSLFILWGYYSATWHLLTSNSESNNISLYKVLNESLDFTWHDIAQPLGMSCALSFLPVWPSLPGSGRHKTAPLNILTLLFFLQNLQKRNIHQKVQGPLWVKHPAVWQSHNEKLSIRFEPCGSTCGWKGRHQVDLPPISVHKPFSTIQAECLQGLLSSLGTASKATWLGSDLFIKFWRTFSLTPVCIHRAKYMCV